MYELAGICATVVFAPDSSGFIGFTLKGTSLEIAFGIFRSDIIVRNGTVPVTIEEMQLAVAASGHSLLASLIPPAKTICYVIGAIIGLIAATRSNEVGAPVVIRPFLAFRVAEVTFSCACRFEIAETTPCDGDIIGFAFDIEVSVAAVLKIAVIDPYIGGFVETEIVPSVTVVRTGTLKGQIAQQEVIAFQIQNTRFFLVLLGGDQFLARQCHDGQVAFVRTDVVGDGDVLCDQNHAVVFAQSRYQFAFVRYFNRGSVSASGHVCTGVSP